MNAKVTPRTVPGFIELLPAEQLAFNRMAALIAQTYESYGFAPLDTPVLELAEILLAKAGGDTEKQIYRFYKGETDLCLRFDLTVPLARYVAQHQNELSFPFRRYHIGKSYRGERPQAGRFREFYQADIDIIGNEKLALGVDAELPSIMYRVLTRLGLKRFHIRMNNRKLLQGFYAALGIGARAGEILRLVDKLDKIGPDALRESLAEQGLTAEQTERILSFVNMTGTTQALLGQLELLGIREPAFQEGLDELRAVTGMMEALGVPETHFQIDLKITRGLDYYTGTVYEVYADDFPTWGAIGSGGRYDNLAEHYTDRKLPGAGMSIGLTRFFMLLLREGLIQTAGQTPAAVLVLPMDEAGDYALRVSQLLRDKGVATELYAPETKFKNKMIYANKIGVPHAVILGADEVKSQLITFKDLQTGEQRQLPLAEGIETLSEIIRQRPLPPVIKDF